MKNYLSTFKTFLGFSRKDEMQDNNKRVTGVYTNVHQNCERVVNETDRFSRKSYLIVSETFYSIQGEGKNVGTPAVFLRLAACNLTCKGFSYQNPHTNEHLGCDTAAVWRKGERWDFEKILQHWQSENWITHLKAGAHLVITGGEPLLQQEALVNFIAALDKIVKPFIEIETNATLLFTAELFTRLNQINASPKLTYAGDNVEKRYRLEVLTQLASSLKTCFKFVLSEPKQIEEIIEKYITPLEISPTKVWLMAEGGTQHTIKNKAAWLVELCKTYNFHYSPRLHIDIWGEVTGM